MKAMKPLACPCCGAELEDRRVGDTWAHPKTGCVLGGFGLSGQPQIASWNLRPQVLPLDFRPAEEWDEDMGPCLWWVFDEDGNPCEEPYVGGPTDLGMVVEIHAIQPGKGTRRGHVMVGAWPGYHTHFTRLPFVQGPPGQGIVIEEEGEG